MNENILSNVSATDHRFFALPIYDDIVVDYNRKTTLRERGRRDAVIHAPYSSAAVARGTTAASSRGIRFYWALFAINTLVFSALLIALATLLLTPYTSLTPLETETLRAAVRSRLDETFDDPLIEAAPGIVVRSSNVRGFRLNGVVYYYYIEGDRNFDPLSRGAVDHDDVVVVLRDLSGPQPLVVYRLRD
ncbi:MAG: hypothetical protein RMJ55_11520 [Roseiflexaceae bacterium]|nr:hypothetical protein [Roseiflexaceae bacterium]